MYESLTKYIPSIENSDDYGEWIIDHAHAGTMDDPKQMSFVAHGKLAIAVEDAIYDFVNVHAVMRLTHYNEILEANGLSWDTESMAGADVSYLDGRAVMALLLGAVRAERFCDGALLTFLKNGSILCWLRRLVELDGC